MIRKLSLILMAVLLAALCACANKTQEPFDAEAAFARILSEVKFAGEMTDASGYAEYTIGDLPEGAACRIYMVGGASVDHAMLFTAADEAGIAVIEQLVKTYLNSLKDEAVLYEPEELPKLEKAVFHRNGTSLIVVVTDDTETVNSILN